MHRDNGTRFSGYFLVYAGRIDIVEGGIDSDKNRPGANSNDTAGRSEKGKRRRNNFITRLDIQRHQADKQRIGSARNADCMLAFAVCSDICFELRHSGPESKSLTLADLADRAGTFIPAGRILSL